jgi:hypothetical protein
VCVRSRARWAAAVAATHLGSRRSLGGVRWARARVGADTWAAARAPCTTRRRRRRRPRARLRRALRRRPAQRVSHTRVSRRRGRPPARAALGHRAAQRGARAAGRRGLARAAIGRARDGADVRARVRWRAYARGPLARTRQRQPGVRGRAARAARAPTWAAALRPMGAAPQSCARGAHARDRRREAAFACGTRPSSPCSAAESSFRHSMGEWTRARTTATTTR